MPRVLLRAWQFLDHLLQVLWRFDRICIISEATKLSSQETVTVIFYKQYNHIKVKTSLWEDEMTTNLLKSTCNSKKIVLVLLRKKPQLPAHFGENNFGRFVLVFLGFFYYADIGWILGVALLPGKQTHVTSIYGLCLFGMYTQVRGENGRRLSSLLQSRSSHMN